MEILRNIDNIDFQVLYAGKVCVDEIPRVRRVARVDCIKTPKFMDDIERYVKILHYMAWINGLGPKPTRKRSKGKQTPKLVKKRSIDARTPSGKKSDGGSTSPVLYKVKRTPLVNPLPRITHVTEEIFNPLDDIEEDEGEDDATTCPPNNTYAAPKKSYKLLGRPKSTPNKVRKHTTNGSGDCEAPKKRIDWFGLLERKWEEDGFR